MYRIYRELELNLRIKPRKRLVRQAPEPLIVPASVNAVCSMDFMHDQLKDGRSIRLFNVIDGFNREASGIEIDFSLPSARVIRALEQIIGWRGKPLALRCDNVLNASSQAQSLADSVVREMQAKVASANEELQKRISEKETADAEIAKLAATAPLARREADQDNHVAGHSCRRIIFRCCESSVSRRSGVYP